MRYIKTLLLLAVAALMPLCAAAQRPSGKGAPSAKYPDFDFAQAIDFWKLWRSGEAFTPEQYARVIEMCHIGYNYMQADVQALCDKYPDSKDLAKRVKAINDLDQGEYSDMETFTRSFTTRMINCALEKQLDDDNRDRAFLLHKRKKEFRDFLKAAKNPPVETSEE